MSEATVVAASVYISPQKDVKWRRDWIRGGCISNARQQTTHGFKREDVIAV